MKRFWTGIVIMALLLAACVGIAVWLERNNRPVAQNLQRASDCAADGQWDLAVEYALRAQARWNKTRKLTAALADHSVLEEVDSVFAQLRVYARLEETQAFCVLCSRLAVMTESIAQNDLPQWYVLL